MLNKKQQKHNHNRFIFTILGSLAISLLSLSLLTKAVELNVNVIGSLPPTTENSVPTALFSHQNNILEIAFNAGESFDTDGNILSYLWNFGDGSTGTGIDASHTYSQPGSYEIVLQVTDDKGAVGQISLIIAVGTVNNNPVADFSWNQQGGIFYFDAANSSDSDGSIVSYQWIFDDGYQGTGINTSHIYNQYGNYSVALKVTDDQNGIATIAKNVSFPAPIVDCETDGSCPLPTDQSAGSTINNKTDDSNGSGSDSNIENIILDDTPASLTWHNLKDNLAVQNMTKKLQPAVAVGALVILYISLISVLSSIFDLLPLLSHLINLFLNFFFWKRKEEKAWGIVYNSSTKEPVDLAIVRLFEAKNNALMQTAVTDKNGRFSFRPEKGLYYLTVAKPSFVFPSVLVRGLAQDGKYSKIYFGNNLEVSDRQTIDLSAPIDPIKATKASFALYDRIKTFLSRLSWPILIIGSIFALFVFWVAPGWFNGFVVALYAVIIALKKILTRPATRPWGKVIDARTKKPLPGIVLRIFDKKYNKLLETKVTDEKGSFSFLLPKGEYYIRTMSYQYKIASQEKIKIKNGYYGETIKVEENQKIRVNIPLAHHRAIVPTTKKIINNIVGVLKPDSIFKYLDLHNKNIGDVLKNK
ncbi:PKD domain-containing protein [Candidatus Microgenomates bacterium]|nr:PKD domain-containing protein [Candidatus Microgenomates bacterium]